MVKVDFEILNPKNKSLITSETELRDFCATNNLTYKLVDLSELESFKAPFAFIHTGAEKNQFNGGNTNHWMFLAGDKVFDSYGLQEDFLFPEWVKPLRLQPKRIQEYGSNVCGEYCCTFYKFVNESGDANDEDLGLEYCSSMGLSEDRNKNDKIVQQVYAAEGGHLHEDGQIKGGEIDPKIKKPADFSEKKEYGVSHFYERYNVDMAIYKARRLYNDEDFFLRDLLGVRGYSRLRISDMEAILEATKSPENARKYNDIVQEIYRAYSESKDSHFLNGVKNLCMNAMSPEYYDVIKKNYKDPPTDFQEEIWVEHKNLGNPRTSGWALNPDNKNEFLRKDLKVYQAKEFLYGEDFVRAIVGDEVFNKMSVYEKQMLNVAFNNPVTTKSYAHMLEEIWNEHRGEPNWAKGFLGVLDMINRLRTKNYATELQTLYTKYPNRDSRDKVNAELGLEAEYSGKKGPKVDKGAEKETGLAPGKNTGLAVPGERTTGDKMNIDHTLDIYKESKDIGIVDTVKEMFTRFFSQRKTYDEMTPEEQRLLDLDVGKDVDLGSKRPDEKVNKIEEIAKNIFTGENPNEEEMNMLRRDLSYFHGYSKAENKNEFIDDLLSPRVSLKLSRQNKNTIKQIFEDPTTAIDHVDTFKNLVKNNPNLSEQMAHVSKMFQRIENPNYSRHFQELNKNSKDDEIFAQMWKAHRKAYNVYGNWDKAPAPPPVKPVTTTTPTAIPVVDPSTTLSPPGSTTNNLNPAVITGIPGGADQSNNATAQTVPPIDNGTSTDPTVPDSKDTGGIWEWLFGKKGNETSTVNSTGMPQPGAGPIPISTTQTPGGKPVKPPVKQPGSSNNWWDILLGNKKPPPGWKYPKDYQPQPESYSELPGPNAVDAQPGFTAPDRGPFPAEISNPPFQEFPWNFDKSNTQIPDPLNFPIPSQVPMPEVMREPTIMPQPVPLFEPNQHSMPQDSTIPVGPANPKKRLRLDGSLEIVPKKSRGAVTAYNTIQTYVPMAQEIETIDTVPFQYPQFQALTAVPQLATMDRGFFKAGTNKLNV